MTEKTVLQTRLTNFLSAKIDVTGGDIINDLRRTQKRTVPADPVTKEEMQIALDLFFSRFKDGEDIPDALVIQYLVENGLVTKQVDR
jgi:hypothetical protein